MSDDPNNFYVTLFSTASHELFPDITHAAFTNEMAQTIDLDRKYKLEVGLSEITCPPPAVGNVIPVLVIGDTNSLIYCNVIQPQFFGNALIRCLSTIITPSAFNNHRFDNIYYVPVEQRHIRHIRNMGFGS
jgi:hypothetical protein